MFTARYGLGIYIQYIYIYVYIQYTIYIYIQQGFSRKTLVAEREDTGSPETPDCHSPPTLESAVSLKTTAVKLQYYLDEQKFNGGIGRINSLEAAAIGIRSAMECRSQISTTSLHSR